MSSCCAYGCTNRQNKAIPGITFHRFPTNQEKRGKWIKAVRRENWLPTEYSRICSVHFRPDMLDRSMKRVMLKENAVPSIFDAFPSYMQINKDPRAPPKDRSQPVPSVVDGSTPQASPLKKLSNSRNESCLSGTDWSKYVPAMLRQPMPEELRVDVEDLASDVNALPTTSGEINISYEERDSNYRTPSKKDNGKVEGTTKKPVTNKWDRLADAKLELVELKKRHFQQEHDLKLKYMEERHELSVQYMKEQHELSVQKLILESDLLKQQLQK